jgi:hypothetical protein
MSLLSNALPITLGAVLYIATAIRVLVMTGRKHNVVPAENPFNGD